MCLDEKQVVQIMVRLDNLEKSTNKTIESLYGDGKIGLLERVARIEETIASVYTQSKNNSDAIEKSAQQATILSEKAVEQSKNLVSQVADETVKAIDGIKESVDDLKKSFDSVKESIILHHADKELHTFRGLLLKRDVLVWVIVGFVVIHSILPREFDLWQIIKNIFGF